MKQKLQIILLTFILFSCSPKIGTEIISKQNALPENEFILVIDDSNALFNDGKKIGTLKSKDNGFSTNCSYDEIIESFKKICRQNGANIINIVTRKEPDQWSSCERIEAIIYKVPDYKIYEKQIEWSKNRKLTWNDFKGKVVLYQPFDAESHCGFGFKSNVVKLFGKTTMKITNTFDCNSSWVSPKSKNNNKLLEHEQLHFDLSEIYARHLRKKLFEKKLSYFNVVNESNKIFYEVFDLYKERQNLYDTETKHGTEEIAQKKWKETIQNELNELEAYSEY